MSLDEKSLIKNQKREVFELSNHVELVEACSVDHGILSLSDEAKQQLKDVFDQEEVDLNFFIPASGSGSRMFRFLFEFAENGEETEQIQKFFGNLENFAFYQSMPLTVRQKLEALQSKYVVEYLLSKEGMNFVDSPKGMIPFHRVDDEIFNPFQEQVLQASMLSKSNWAIHFTVQEKYEDLVKESIKSLGKQVLRNSEISFSYQNSESDAFCFTKEGELALENGVPLRRPAGHGALLENLNRIEGDIVLIKNIDNIQHIDKAGKSLEVWKIVTGLLISFKRELKLIERNFSIEALRELNNKYDFLSQEEIDKATPEMLEDYMLRPTRVCGMVKNEGEPGGGPFWIKDGDLVTKQIVEKVQISTSIDQQDIVAGSSHFNPVFIALSKTDIYENPLDLTQFVDESKYLVVNKSHKEDEIIYREMPGLWNGAMSNWNTIFVEIPVEVFSPVKNVLDLLNPAHVGND